MRFEPPDQDGPAPPGTPPGSGPDADRGAALRRALSRNTICPPDVYNTGGSRDENGSAADSISANGSASGDGPSADGAASSGAGGSASQDGPADGATVSSCNSASAPQQTWSVSPFAALALRREPSDNVHVVAAAVSEEAPTSSARFAPVLTTDAASAHQHRAGGADVSSSAAPAASSNRPGIPRAPSKDSLHTGLPPSK